MYSVEDLKSLHGFLRATGEGNLKKMLVGGKMTEVHLRMLQKIARAVKEEEFATFAETDTYPKVKFAPAEIAAKETFWAISLEACAKVGLITAGSAAAAAKKAA